MTKVERNAIEAFLAVAAKRLQKAPGRVPVNRRLMLATIAWLRNLLDAPAIEKLPRPDR